MIIRTTKQPATETSGEYVAASARGFTARVRVPWDYALSAEDMHRYAARKLAQRITGSYAAPELRVTGTWARGYIFADDAEDIDTESSASRQHYIDTGRYLRKGEAIES